MWYDEGDTTASCCTGASKFAQSQETRVRNFWQTIELRTVVNVWTNLTPTIVESDSSLQQKTGVPLILMDKRTFDWASQTATLCHPASTTEKQHEIIGVKLYEKVAAESRFQISEHTDYQHPVLAAEFSNAHETLTHASDENKWYTIDNMEFGDRLAFEYFQTCHCASNLAFKNSRVSSETNAMIVECAPQRLFEEALSQRRAS